MQSVRPSPVIEPIYNELMNLFSSFWASAGNEDASLSSRPEETEIIQSERNEEVRSARLRF